MSKHSWSDNAINLVGAAASRFPAHEVVHYQALRQAPENVREILRETNAKMSEAESNKDLTADGVKNQCAKIAKEAIEKLEQVLEPAQRACDRRLQALNAKLATVIAKPSENAREIRSWIAKQQSPIMSALAKVNDTETVAALCGAPSYLSGLSSADLATLRARVVGETVEAKEAEQIQQALGVISAATKSAAAMINQRAQTSTAPTLRPAEIAKAS
jgi:predicted NBD/HSP70 family sugar kinase